MNPNGRFNREFEEEYRPIDSYQQQFSELDIDFPKKSPMRRKSKRREGGFQPKHRRDEKKINFRLKYHNEW
jgi:hypothetical protein